MMYGTIQLSQVVFGMHVSSLSGAKNSLMSVQKPKIEKTSTSQVLNLYQEQFDQLYQLVSTYGALLEADITQVAETGKELDKTDQLLGHTLFSGLKLGG
ncbi:TIGR04197 family type VII secretion effector [Granulicatella adiacens ATCC 49175]|uniref:TIGR04197 family type VII secretion effector n=1 Tax=Granulicatella adiacens ATCC 49175 TaxID=638301 RepID=C8NIU7_9LACT|nr:TIGR04197 family type VII secretion effector [Granulicatella adiacens]EEW36494.1 hypothetical protein HMPREF0444_1842 [Granulicatella adiacens ATCC 49175]UWP38073.1 TIGR04197 family type VII secretion effector [Granulicatella adiacens ATCC 49175]